LIPGAAMITLYLSSHPILFEECRRMTQSSDTTADVEYFQILHRGGLMIVVPATEIEQLPSNVIDTAAQMVLAPLKANPSMNVVFDLSRVGFFGSEFISFLLRCHVIVKKHHCEMALAGVSERIRELLRQTALDTLWAIYDNRTQAVEALDG
jgi:anti-sigma B factor antagonist